MAYKNMDKKREYNRKWAKEHPIDKEVRRNYEKKWREENPFKVQAQKERYYEKNKERIKVKSLEYYEKVRKNYLREHADEERIKNREKSKKKYAMRKALLLKLRHEGGGKCFKCGYDEDVRILQFHHHKKNKMDNVAEIQSLKKIKSEADKCILLCPNCHAIETLKQKAKQCSSN